MIASLHASLGNRAKPCLKNKINASPGGGGRLDVQVDPGAVWLWGWPVEKQSAPQDPDPGQAHPWGTLA